MEGFSRILWGLAPYLGGGGGCAELENTYLTGLANGTDPDCGEYWGEMRDFDQRIVETAAIGLGLILAPDKLWKPLSAKQKENLYNWLNMVNSVKSVDNNWQLFAVLVNLGFKSVNMPYNREAVERSHYGLHNSGADNMLAFEKDNIIFVRRKCSEYKIEENGTVYSKWSPYKGVEVETRIIPTADGHIRQHTVKCTEECTAYDCAASFAPDAGGGEIFGSGEEITVTCAPNTNISKPLTKMKAIKYVFGKGTYEVETKVVY